MLILSMGLMVRDLAGCAIVPPRNAFINFCGYAFKPSDKKYADRNHYRNRNRNRSECAKLESKCLSPLDWLDFDTDFDSDFDPDAP